MNKLLAGSLAGITIALLVVLAVQVGKDRPVGAVPGNEFQDFVSINGVNLWGARTGIRTASSTLCSLVSPKHATSTLLAGGLALRSRPTTTLEIEAGKNVPYLTGGANITGTTTMLASTSVVGGQYLSFDFFATGSLIANPGNATSSIQAVLDRVFSPGQILTIKAFNDNGDSMAGSLASGTCSALWKEF